MRTSQRLDRARLLLHSDDAGDNPSMRARRAGRVGDLIEVTPVVTRATRTMIFTRGEFLVAGEPIFQAASIWKVTGK